MKRLRHEELRHENSQEISHNIAMKAQSETKKETCECFYCKKKGHIKKDCWKFKRNQEVQKLAEGNTNSTDNKASTVFKPEQFSRMLMAWEDSRTIQSTWLIDSGTSNHITGSKEHFVSYVSIIGHTLEIVNSCHITIRGKGNVQILGSNGLLLVDV